MCGLPATARDRRPSGRGSARRRSCTTAFVWRAREKAVIAEWKVPPENVALARATPRTATGPRAWNCCNV